MSSRTLKHPPLVEHLFEVRWSHPSGRGALYDEYELTLGMLYERIRERFPHRERVLGHLPRDVYDNLAVESLVFDRFLGERPLVGRLGYPLVQYGPGIGSHNVDKSSYSWPDVKAGILSYYDKLSQVHTDLAGRVVAIALRSIDFFETNEPGELLRSKLKVTVDTELGSLKHLEGAREIPRLQTTWRLDGDRTLLRVKVGPGSVGDANGLLLDIEALAQGAALTQRGMEALIDFLHTLTGDAFFALLTTELHDELGRIQ